MNWFKKIAFKVLPKIIICFEQGGCMGTQLDFKWIGYVTKAHYKEHDKTYPEIYFYEVQPIILGSYENRNYKDKQQLPIQDAWDIQHIGFNLYIHYK